MAGKRNMAVRNIWILLSRCIAVLVAVALILFVMVLYWPLTQTNARLRTELARLESELQQAREQAAAKIRYCHALEHDPKTIEREARIQLSLARPNETIIHFVPGAPSLAPRQNVP
jgi:cell division protein FtsB